MFSQLFALCRGLMDGWKEPYELTSGFSYRVHKLNEVYDTGVNCGQFLRSPLHCQRRGAHGN